MNVPKAEIVRGRMLLGKKGGIQVHDSNIIRDNRFRGTRKSALTGVTAPFICTLKLPGGLSSGSSVKVLFSSEF